MSKTYSLVWTQSSWRRYNDGFLVHASDDNLNDGRGSNRTLCGVKWTDAGWGQVGEHGEPGCIRCRDALRKLGIIAPRQKVC